MYKNILVPVAFETGRDTMKSIEIAEALGEKGGKITALHVIEEIPSYVAPYWGTRRGAFDYFSLK